MDWKSFIKETRSKFANLNKELPNTFDGFNLMGKDAKKNGIVDEKTKEFVALGIAISTRCESCIGMHVEALVRLGVSKAELVEVLAMCCYMGGGPSITLVLRHLRLMIN